MWIYTYGTAVGGEGSRKEYGTNIRYIHLIIVKEDDGGDTRVLYLAELRTRTHSALVMLIAVLSALKCFKGDRG